jgi:hypothetical protein
MKRWAKPHGYLIPTLLVFVLFAGQNATASDQRAVTVEQIEADWDRQDDLRENTGIGGGILAAEDALGGCDGKKTGKWGFHTAREPQPWWHVDLGRCYEVEQVVLFNRCDEFAGRNAHLRILVSEDGTQFREVYQNPGITFFGQVDDKPLVVVLDRPRARFVRVQHPGNEYLHLDEVEVYGVGSTENLALGRPAMQSSTSPWSIRHAVLEKAQRDYYTERHIERGRKLAYHLREQGLDVARELGEFDDVEDQLNHFSPTTSAESRHAADRRVRWAIRRLALQNPLLDFDDILFIKRAPALFPHMSDQYYGWWSRGGGGVYRLSGFRGDQPRVRCLTENWPLGSFLRPDISHDGKRVLVAWCRYYPHLAAVQDKVDKASLPEDSFYHLYEMSIDGSTVRQLTFGRYDDFDGRYLPDGDIAFLSTRKGTALQVNSETAAATTRATCPDSYVRCGGGNSRPVAVFTLHAIDADGKNLRPISAFENFEWTPAVASDGRLLYARWDYIDRFNGPFISLWSTNPDGTRSQLVYGNYTTKPQCVFEARPIPNSQKLVFTASAHHSITGGSLALLDTARGTEFERPLTRLTPEVPFPETEAWVDMYYAGPYPLSEQHFLVSWSDRRLPPHRLMPSEDPNNPRNALGLYLYDAWGNLTLLHRDPDISSMNPLPIRRCAAPPQLPDRVAGSGSPEGRFLLQNVYDGLPGVAPGSIRRLRIVAVPPKVQPHMNKPVLGVSREDPGKFVLGTVPVEADGSAYFRVPSGIPVFFQALDEQGLAVQTMRSLTYVQPDETLSCIGCHESRMDSPRAGAMPLAIRREASRIRLGPEGTWPLRYDELVQPVLDAKCVDCHHPAHENRAAAAIDLTAARSYDTLVQYADEDLHKLAFERDQSLVGECPASNSQLLRLLTSPERHYDVELDDEQWERLTTWMDTYAHRTGSFSDEQEDQLRALRRKLAAMLIE